MPFILLVAIIAACCGNIGLAAILVIIYLIACPRY